MNKKIIMLIIGIILLMLGFLGVYIFNGEKSIDNEELEDIKAVQEKTLQEDDIQTEELKSEEQKFDTENKSGKVLSKPANTNIPHRNITLNPAKEQSEESPLFSETVVQDKEFEDPYVESDGTIVVKNEFKPHLKSKIFFRGVWYDIKTKFADSVSN